MPSPTDHARNEKLIKFWASYPDVPVSNIAKRFSLSTDRVREIIKVAREAGDQRVQQTRVGATR